MQHIPVMATEILQKMRETPRTIENYFDGTFGRGGHVRLVLNEFPAVKATAFDRDTQAVEYAAAEFADEISSGRLRVVHQNYVDFSEALADDSSLTQKFDFMLLDLGVSSPQLDQAERGFSFYDDGPLDMRMDQTQELTARDVLREFSEEELVELFQELGEVPRPFRVVRAVVHDRKEKEFSTTRDLAGLIERVEGWSKKGHHPATRYFMALRLYVNRELEQVEKALPDLMAGLNEGGRLAVITFHSLEDRIVKNIFKNNKKLGKPVNKKVIIAEWNERKSNPRARSAKLRVFQREGSDE